MSEHIGCHTCNQNGGDALVLRNAPFATKGKSIAADGSKKLLPFLGKGCYLWEEDAPYTHSVVWGQTRIRKPYYVVRFEVNTKIKNVCMMLDLIGRKRDREYFRKQLITARTRFGGQVKIGKVIDALQKITKETKSPVFPYNIIRASDDSSYAEVDRMEFSDEETQYSNIRSEKWIICICKDKKLHLSNPVIVVPTKKTI